MTYREFAREVGAEVTKLGRIDLGSMITVHHIGNNDNKVLAKIFLPIIDKYEEISNSKILGDYKVAAKEVAQKIVGVGVDLE